MVSHLTGSGDGGSDVPGSLGPEVSDPAAVLAVPVGQELDAPALGDSLEPFSFGDGDHVDQRALGDEVVERNLGAENALRVRDPLVDGASAYPELHDVGDLLGDPGNHLGLGVGKDADILDVQAVVPGEGGLVVLGLVRSLGRLFAALGDADAPRQESVEVVGPDFACGLQAEDAVLVEPDRCDLHRRDLHDGDGHLDLESGSGALGAAVHYESVGHACLVTGEPLDFGGSADLRPGVEPRRLRLCSLPRAVCPRSSLRTSSLWHI